MNKSFKFTLVSIGPLSEGQLDPSLWSNCCAGCRLTLSLAVSGIQDVGLSELEEVFATFPQLLFKRNAKCIRNHPCLVFL